MSGHPGSSNRNDGTTECRTLPTPAEISHFHENMFVFTTECAKIEPTKQLLRAVGVMLHTLARSQCIPCAGKDILMAVWEAESSTEPESHG